MDQPLDLAALRAQVDTVLRDFLTGKAAAAAVQHLPQEAARALADFLAAGGKRLRPLLCVLGWQAAAGRGPIAPIIQVGAALEMFHAFCLIHDDIMDNSASRRGQPTIHRALAARHADGRTQAAAQRLGTGTAILIGDLALTWSGELLYTADLTAAQLSAVLPLVDIMRTEVMYGQYLDLTSTGHPTDDVERALAIIRYKTAKYTIERPLHIGAALAGASDPFRAALSEFALPIGEAFQMRDDILGVYGNPAQTGKPCLDDLRDGKHTTLVALALRHATPDQRRTLSVLIGDPALGEIAASRIRRLLTDTGAQAAVEQLIQDRWEQAEQVLARAPFSPPAINVLRELAHTALARKK
ncbi:polyprenyl synthetase family protein [Streptomyces spectabilis]|uniref:Geranylgeranyl diphosphate synthase type I n=1 Tax=Streptomyces spectabilis TaxID=68270 RepID=A0A7W8B5A9_STRST|nr:polyprenyl synthetase family protein [Streptomyces spectabilis]MBB5109971.1 geranylgeranyl diphosphate synthase type I [Streptomyces spectabilis]